MILVLHNQPQRAILERHEAAARLRLQLLEGRARTMADRPSAPVAAQARREFEAEWRQAREEAFKEIIQEIGPSQDAVERELIRTGARGIRRFQAINAMATRIPPAAVRELAAHPDVAEISLDETHTPQLAVSAPSLGANVFWSAGYTGAGEAVAVMDTGVRTIHPAFVGLNIVSEVFLDAGQNDSCFADDTTFNDNQGHGSHVAGIVASRGAPGWTNYFGVARGLGTLYNLKTGFKILNIPGKCEGGALTYSSDVLAALNWLVQQAPWVKIVNYSYGSSTTADDTLSARQFDYFAETYGLTVAVSAGNSGPAPGTVSSPAIAYNVISTGSVNTLSTTDRGDDFVADHSSRGPTAVGRKKPDVVAPGTRSGGIRSADYLTDGFVGKSGTSMAAPHIAGAAALLRSAGVQDPLSIKALLLNTTDTRGWASDWGWGYANLSRAFAQRQNVVRTEFSGGSRYFTASATGIFSSTLVWNRNLIHPSAQTGCLSLLNQYLYSGTSNAALGSWLADRDNVVQVDAPASGAVVLKVKNAAPLCQFPESFAIAANVPLASAAGPALTLSCSAPSVVQAGAQFDVNCTAANPGDLRVFNVEGPVNWLGQSGGTSLSYGNLEPGSVVTRTWTMTAPFSPGSYSLRANAASSSYGESFTAEVTLNLTVQASTAGCTYAASSDALAAPATGGIVNLSIRTEPGCPWSVTSLPAWITVSGASQGLGPASVTLSIAPNAGAARMAAIDVAGLTVPVRQLDAGACGGSSTCRLVALPHLAFGQGWTTSLTVANGRSSTTEFSVSFFGDSGAPASMPFTGGVGARSVLNATVAAGGLRFYEAEDPALPAQGAWGLAAVDAGVTVHATFRRRTPQNLFYEAAVQPVAGYTQFSLPFDATLFAPASAQVFTGFAIANLNPLGTAQVSCVARDESGVLIQGGTLSIPELAPLGHWSEYLFPALTGRRGRLECRANTLVAAIAIRAIGSDAFSTLPVSGD
ncbi:MAG: S8 family serine peptidase [Bryobacteraceae bacterium]|nr:S8 family serine peptidase [Bryobacteraceae bacterium]